VWQAVRLQGARANVHHKFEKQAFTAWKLKRFHIFTGVFVKVWFFHTNIWDFGWISMILS
jgi:hypothetical protein